MRFRGKFKWLQLSASILWLVMCLLWFHKHPHDGIGQAYLLLGILQLSIATAQVTSYFFTWWDVTEEALVQHRYRSERTIPWSEITRIGPWHPGKKPQYNWLEVSFARAAPISDRGNLLIQAEDQDSLLRALRAHAPQAAFEL